MRFTPRARLFVLATVVGSAAIVAAQTNGTPERFSAAAINTNVGAAGSIDIVVDRWSSNAESDKLLKAMADEASEKVLDIVQDLPVKGYFNSPGSLRWDIHFARRAPLPDGGERVVLITDRRISFWEATNRPRSFDYPFTVIELRINRDGRGEGKLSVATKVIADGDMITLENYDIQPVQLTNVKRERSSG